MFGQNQNEVKKPELCTAVNCTLPADKEAKAGVKPADKEAKAGVKPADKEAKAGVKPADKEAKAGVKTMTAAEKKEARKASAKKMLEHKKDAIKTLVEFAKRMNADGKDAAVKEAAEYLSGEKKASAIARISVLDQIFKDNKPVKAVDIFMNFEKGRSEMITLCKRAASKGIIIEYDETTKTYTKK